MFKLSEIASVLKGHLVGPDGALRDSCVDGISAVTTDSRQARPGQLFFALRGPRFDGHNYAGQAFTRTRTAVVVEHEVPDVEQQIIVKDTLRALGDLAGHFRRRFAPLVIAITGTNGKTTTKDLLGRMMEKKGNTVKTHSTLNNQIGLPLTLLRLRPDTRYCVVELGTNHPGEIEYLARIAEPDLALLTNIGYGHLAGFASRNDLIKEKLALITNLKPAGIAVVNARIKGLWTEHKVVTFSLGRNGNYHPTRVRLGEDGSSFTMAKRQYKTGLLGRGNVENIVGAIAAADQLEVPYTVQQEAIAGAEPAPMRMEPRYVGSYYILNDCYNANPNSMKEALYFMAHLGRRRVGVLGDMLELGRASTALHKRVGQLARRSVDLLVSVGDQSRLYAGVHFGDRGAAIDYLGKNLRSGDAVLFKASRALKFEEIVEPVIERLKGRGGR